MADAPPPQIVYPQNPLASPQVILNVVGTGIAWAVAHYGLSTLWSGLDPQTQQGIVTAIALVAMGALNILGKAVFPHGQLSFAAPMMQPMARDLPPGTSVVTVAHPESGLSPSVVALSAGQQVVHVPMAVAAPPPNTAPAPLVTPAPPNTAQGQAAWAGQGQAPRNQLDPSPPVAPAPPRPIQEP